MTDKIVNKRANRLWLRLIQIYGSRVAEQYGKNATPPWLELVDDLTDEQIAHGLRVVPRETPIYPPTLGQFATACRNMPVEQAKGGATPQELLCAYAARSLHRLVLTGELPRSVFSLPWSYVYRETWDAGRPRGMERCAEVLGVVIELGDGARLGWSVAMMEADKDGHQQAVRDFRLPARPQPASEAA